MRCPSLLVATLGLALAAAAQAAEPVHYHWFEYVGHDPAQQQPLPAGHYRNPVLAGFYPDPSAIRVGDRYYLVNSSFAWFPGLPISESRDLVHWKTIGHAIDRATQMDFDGAGVSRGLFAATLAFHDGLFYLACTEVDGRGNFIVTARDPAGPWSDPTWLPDVDGIDPSLFFDDDGQAYLLNNGPPQGQPRYEGHRAIWIQSFNPATRQTFGPRQVIVDGGVDPAANPIWIEGPHLFKRDGWYYLSAAEGGTGPQHSQVVLRSRAALGPYLPDPHNPILTQRDLPASRPDPVVNAGHADLLEAADGNWWAVFLASRSYGDGHYNTGRETWLLPVQWQQGWPRITAPGQVLTQTAPGPAFLRQDLSQAPMAGNFRWRDEFDQPTLDTAWQYLRAPRQDWARLDVEPGSLTVQALAEGLDSAHNPSFLARRQQHLVFEASTALQVPTSPGVAAGIAAFQNENHWYFLGVHRRDGQLQLFLEKRNGTATQAVASTPLAAGTTTLQLKIEGNAGAYAFGYASDAGHWQWLRRNEDGTILSTDVAGGFVGTQLGPYARAEGTAQEQADATATH